MGRRTTAVTERPALRFNLAVSRLPRLRCASVPWQSQWAASLPPAWWGEFDPHPVHFLRTSVTITPWEVEGLGSCHDGRWGLAGRSRDIAMCEGLAARLKFQCFETVQLGQILRLSEWGRLAIAGVRAAIFPCRMADAKKARGKSFRSQMPLAAFVTGSINSWVENGLVRNARHPESSAASRMAGLSFPVM